ncbi:uncharacterized protein LOC134281400 [Saccostrea cucullata]|uniref:uncharacterized protein LOC134281400 n=1 Tax=Saccostrea cuccullata TaxID=36930 RepID=UPI002ED32D49
MASPQAGVAYQPMNFDQGVAAPYTLVNVDGSGNIIQPQTQNRPQTTNLDIFMWVLAAFGTVVACPFGIFSICYAYMSKDEAFYPMRRYYRFTAMLVSSVAILSFVITVIWTMSVFGLSRY